MLGFSSAFKALLRGNHRYFHTVDIDLSTGVLRLTDASEDVTYQGEVYQVSHGLMAVPDAKQTTDIKTNEVAVTLSAINTATRAIVFDQAVTYLNRPLSIRRHYLDDQGNEVGVVSLFSGVMTKRDYHDGDDAFSIQFKAASWWAAFEKISGVETSLASQQRHHASDKGFEHCPAASLNIRWGSR